MFHQGCDDPIRFSSVSHWAMRQKQPQSFEFLARSVERNSGDQPQEGSGLSVRRGKKGKTRPPESYRPTIGDA